MINAVEIIFLVFFGLLILILLIPIVITLFLYFTLKGNKYTLRKLISEAKDTIVKILNGPGSSKINSQQSEKSDVPKVEDAEFREIE